MKIIFFILLTFLLTNCSVENTSNEGPKGTLWVGGEDGGAFINVTHTTQPDIFQGLIYYQNGHDVWFKGNMKLTGQETLVTDSRDSYLFWDGEILHLSEGGVLIPI